MDSNSYDAVLLWSSKHTDKTNRRGSACSFVLQHEQIQHFYRKCISSQCPRRRDFSVLNYPMSVNGIFEIFFPNIFSFSYAVLMHLNLFTVKDELRYWNAVGDLLYFSNMVKRIFIYTCTYTYTYTYTHQQVKFLKYMLLLFSIVLTGISNEKLVTWFRVHWNPPMVLISNN